VENWGSLPEAVRTAAGKEAFKRGLGKSDSNTAVPGRGIWIMMKKTKKMINAN
jgi:hypothetical protein